ncbi:MAG: hypothetical protein GWO86_01630 [Planctomycetes bacterium]|nr:hypothetical protein [Planctomycetota bacterium]
MKEFDFLPEWYRRKNRQKTHYREQYTAIISLVVIMLTWSFFSFSNVMRVEAQCEALENAQMTRAQSSGELDSIEKELGRLRSKTDILKSVDSKISVSNVFAEMSFLLDGPVVLDKIEIKKERSVVDTGDARRAPIVRVAAGGSNNKSKSAKEEIYRFRMTITGVASDATEVAQLLRKLEQSPYFCQVVPNFSRNRIVQNRQVSEFEIYCYIANYRLDEK